MAPKTARLTTRKNARPQIQREIDQSLSRAGERPVMEIWPGDRVTIADRFGQQRTGRAVMKGPYGWVLSMGGKHGTPGIATPANIIAVRCGKKK